ncbi:Mfa1 family fimbria major subunit [Bacteroides sp. CG01]|uniref:Mfa1 family fimbria major subunit n=1 Tax=Bacteroides sp. CG01 TaxID=3096000 RepID=UPI002AFEC805|nr:Mfa1 family fimbria major subunit [Bacteroides sp. CG01]
MKKKNLFMLALASLAFVACSNEDIVPVVEEDIDYGVVTDPKGDAWVAVGIKTPSQSRGLNTPDHQNGTAVESELKKVRAIFFTADADPEVTADILLTNAEAGVDATGQPTGSAGTAFKVPGVSKRILIVANPSATFQNDAVNSKWITGTKYSVVNAALTNTAASISSTDGFMMTNAKGDLEPSITEDGPTLGDPKDLSLYKTDAGAKANPLTINIDRVVAKVRVTITQTSSKADISEAKWVLNTTNKSYYPLSKRTPTWLEQQNVPTGGFRAPFDQYKKGSYRIDPNYTTHPAGSYNVYDENHIDAGATVIPWHLTTESEYCLENTQNQAGNTHDNTTQILVKAKYMPKEYQKADGTTTTDQETNGDWMLIDGGFYTFTTLMDWIEKELKYKYLSTHPDPIVITTPLTTAFNKYLVGISLAAVPLPATADAAAITTLMQDFKDTKTGILGVDDRAKTVDVLTYYKGGYSFYKAMIKHDDTSLATNELGEFGVVRNSVYDISVTKFNDPGYPTIPPIVTDKDEDDDLRMSILIDVNPWTWYTQEVEF